MLVRGIRLLSQKLLDLLKILIGQGSLQLLTEKEFSLLEFDLWQNSLTALFDELRVWEMANVGELQFSKAFMQIVAVMRDPAFKLPIPQPPETTFSGLPIHQQEEELEKSRHDSDELNSQNDPGPSEAFQEAHSYSTTVKAAVPQVPSELNESTISNLLKESETVQKQEQAREKVEQHLDQEDTVIQQMWDEYSLKQSLAQEQKERAERHLKRKERFKKVEDIYQEQYQIVKLQQKAQSVKKPQIVERKKVQPRRTFKPISNADLGVELSYQDPQTPKQNPESFVKVRSSVQSNKSEMQLPKIRKLGEVRFSVYEETLTVLKHQNQKKYQKHLRDSSSSNVIVQQRLPTLVSTEHSLDEIRLQTKLINQKRQQLKNRL